MKLILLFFASLFVAHIIAQPTMSVSWAPQPGDQWKQLITNEFPDPGEAGANKVWDFRNLTPSGDGTIIFDFKTPSEGISSECYPEATVTADLILEGFGSGFAFGYYAQMSGSFFALGEASSFGTKTIYDDPQEFNYVGLSFGESVSDDYSGTTESEYFSNNFGGQTTYTYDGYGTVLFPERNLDNVIRLFQIDVETDTFSIGALLEVELDSIFSYAYIAPGSIFPVALSQRTVTYTESILGGVSMGQEFDSEDQTFSYNPDFGVTTSVIEETTDQTLRIYPTIAKNMTQIESEVIGMHFTIVDFSGKTVHKGVIESKLQKIDLSTFRNGEYLIITEMGGNVGRFIKLD